MSMDSHLLVPSHTGSGAMSGRLAPEAASQTISQRSGLAFRYVQQRDREPPVSRVTRNLAITGSLA